MDIFKAGGTAYVVIPKEVSKETALNEANKYFKESKESLNIWIGYAKGENLIIKQRGGNVWVVSRKGASHE